MSAGYTNGPDVLEVLAQQRKELANVTREDAACRAHIEHLRREEQTLREQLIAEGVDPSDPDQIHALRAQLQEKINSIRARLAEMKARVERTSEMLASALEGDGH